MRSDRSAALLESNYSIYSINGGFEERPRGISELGCLVSTPWTHKSFIDKCRLTSQTGLSQSSTKEMAGLGTERAIRKLSPRHRRYRHSKLFMPFLPSL